MIQKPQSGTRILLRLCSGFDDMDMYSRVLLPVPCESGLQGEKNVGGQHSVHVRNKKVCLFKKNGRKKRELKKIWWKMLGKTSRGCSRVESINLMGKNT